MESADAGARRLNPGVSASIPIGYAVGSVTDWLRRITVRIHGPGGTRGSGVLWRSDGLVVTNAHVARTRTMTVHLEDGKKLTARLAARDAGCDLAALRIDAKDLPCASARSAADLRAGELVLAVGNPFDGDGAVAVGILHACPGAAPFVFADIRLAPGNSGGPLADSRGSVIGVNSAIVNGLGCAVTSDTVERFLRSAGLTEAA